MRGALIAIGVWLVASILLPVASAKAQVTIPGVACSPRSVVVDKLGKKYSEKQIGVGIVGPEAILEMWASEKGTFTMLVTTKDGRTCILASGHELDIQPFEITEGV